MIHETGKWIGETAEKCHKHDDKLSKGIIEFLKKENCKNVVDFGCGMGLYVRDLNSVGITTCGFDGNPVTPKLTNNTCGVIDLSVDFDLKRQFDWVVSLEVGEHLPKKYEKTYIQNLDKHAKNGIILSWALVNQGGAGHVNEASNQYIKNIFNKLGYENDLNAENILRTESKLWWFRKTIMVFRKPSQNKKTEFFCNFCGKKNHVEL